MSSLLVRSAAWIGASIGLSGFLVVVGWLIVVGQRSMLGVQLATPGTPELIGIAAAFFLDMLQYFLDWCIELLDWTDAHKRSVVLLLALSICLLAVSYHPRSRKRFARSATLMRKFVARLEGRGTKTLSIIRDKLPMLVAILVSVIAVGDLVSYHMPASTITQTLIRNDLSAPNPFTSRTLLKGATVRLWTQVQCAHIAGRNPRLCPSQLGDYIKAIKGRHFISLILTLALVTILAVLMARSPDARVTPSGTSAFWGLLVGSAVVSVSLNLVMLPMTYGSVVRLPEFPEADIYLALSEKNKTPFLPNMQINEDLIKGYILADDGKTLMIYAKGYESPILEISASQIRVISRRPNNDVLTSRLYQLFNLNDPN